MSEPAPEEGSPYLRAMVLVGAAELDPAQEELVEQLVTGNPGWYVERTSDEWGPRELAESAAEAGAELVVAAGGDGTASAVASALSGTGIPMAILPFGTANDFARTLQVGEMDAARAALGANRIVAVDGLRVGFAEGGERFVLNVANGGLAWDIGEALDDETKGRWGALAYARGALEVIADRRVHRVRVQVDDEAPVELEALTLAVSSGRTCGGGLLLAPTADPQDGLLEVTILRVGTPGAVAALAARMRLGVVETDEHLVRLRGRRVTLQSEPPMRFVLDGELAELHPRTFEIVPGCVRVHVGEGYAREPQLTD